MKTKEGNTAMKSCPFCGECLIHRTDDGTECHQCGATAQSETAWNCRTPTNNIDRAIAFYLDSAFLKQELGFTYSDAVVFNDKKLEQCHGYIQWLFPSDEPSAFILDAPVVTQDTLLQYEEFKSIIRPRMEQAYSRIVQFYFSEVGPAHEWQWMSPRNHNFLRCTRILKSLKLFGLVERQHQFWTMLDYIYSQPGCEAIIGPVTYEYWLAAYEGREPNGTPKPRV